ncbi:hypothetical protein [Roseateles sp.]|uniref:hypothetical protein n=1 Tax=Roseateles sp. TaxID=1971397 RepID=UPI00286C6774|nr:hypothetical protein [Roseateles sp.]
MQKLTLSATAIAMTLGLATATPSASAKDRYPEMMAAADANKDGMVSKEEFLSSMSKAYDDKMGKMMKMSAADRAKMVKSDQMTVDGYRALFREIMGGN